MYKIYSLPQRKIAAIALAWAIAGGIFCPVRANPDLSGKGSPGDRDSGASFSVIYNTPPDLSQGGRPGDRRGAAGRGICSSNVNPERLVTLVPKTIKGLTAEKFPTFWFAVPYSADNFHTVEFVLVDDRDEDVYRTEIPPTEELPGLVSVTLPKTTPELETNRTYNWFVTVYCEDPQQDEPQRIFAKGAIERIELDSAIAQELATADEQQKAVLYGKHGLWYEMLDQLVTLRRQGQAQENWQKVLEAVELEELSSQAIIDLPPTEE